MARVGSAGFVILLGACGAGEPAAPLPENAVAFVAPPMFADWWERTESCSGRRGDPAEIDWFVVPGADEFTTDRGPKVADWSQGRAGNRITVAGSFVNDELVVRHEMLHVLLDDAGHPEDYFIDKCHLTWQSWGSERPVAMTSPELGAAVRAR